MNGRVYDPVLGRFLTPDPLVQAPTLSQSWNRYSYVWNNPLRNTDPSGYKTSSTTSTEYAQEVQRNGKQADVDVVEAGPNGSTTITKGGAGIKTIQKKGSENTGTKTESSESTEQYQERMRKQLNCGCRIDGPDKDKEDKKAKGPGTKFDTADEAASDGLLYVTQNPVFNEDGELVEQGGDILPVEGGGFTYNDIQSGVSKHVDVRVSKRAVGWFHSHPKEGSRADKDNRYWSRRDKRNHKNLERTLGRSLKAYIGGTDGAVRMFETGGPRRGVVIQEPGYLTP